MSLDPYTKTLLRGVRVLHLAAADSMLNPNLRDQLRYLRDLGMDVGTASIDGPLARRLRDEDGFAFEALPLTREFAPLSDLRAVHEIAARLRGQNWDIVHTHTPKGNLVGQWAARLAGVPRIIQTLHGFYFHDRMPAALRRIWIEIERFSASHSDAVLFQNPEDVATALGERIAPVEKIALLGNGIDLERFRPVSAEERERLKRERGIPPRRRVVGMVGRFVKEKGIGEFLATARSLSVRLSDVHFILVGHKVASERAGGAIERLEIPRELEDRFSVFTNRDDMPELYGCMDVNVLPSFREGFPRVLLEGSACGLPQIATNIRGCRQAVENGTTGWLVEPGDAQALAGAIEGLLGAPEICRALGSAGRAKAEKEFDQRLVFERVAQSYARLILGAV
jgi:glycosyltransferase involved in cell wall biosynthesis